MNLKVHILFFVGFLLTTLFLYASPDNVDYAERMLNYVKERSISKLIENKHSKKLDHFARSMSKDGRKKLLKKVSSDEFPLSKSTIIIQSMIRGSKDSELVSFLQQTLKSNCRSCVSLAFSLATDKFPDLDSTAKSSYIQLLQKILESRQGPELKSMVIGNLYDIEDGRQLLSIKKLLFNMVKSESTEYNLKQKASQYLLNKKFKTKELKKVLLKTIKNKGYSSKDRLRMSVFLLKNDLHQKEAVRVIREIMNKKKNVSLRLRVKAVEILKENNHITKGEINEFVEEIKKSNMKKYKKAKHLENFALHYSVKIYLEMLTSDNILHRMSAKNRLEEISGTSFGYNPRADKGKRKEAIDKWEDWAKRKFNN